MNVRLIEFMIMQTLCLARKQSLLHVQSSGSVSLVKHVSFAHPTNSNATSRSRPLAWGVLSVKQTSTSGRKRKRTHKVFGMRWR